jgi:hypothetical protein
MTLELHEEEILFAMYDLQLIGNSYKSIQKVCSMIKWIKIAKKYGIKKGCKKVLRSLASKGYINFHGKSGRVASLSRLGVLYVIGKKES